MINKGFWCFAPFEHLAMNFPQILRNSAAVWGIGWIPPSVFLHFTAKIYYLIKHWIHLLKSVGLTPFIERCKPNFLRCAAPSLSSFIPLWCRCYAPYRLFPFDYSINSVSPNGLYRQLQLLGIKKSIVLRNDWLHPLTCEWCTYPIPKHWRQSVAYLVL